MSDAPRILPIVCPFGHGSTTYVYYIDAPRPALVDTGVAASPLHVIEPALAAAGLRLSDVKYILATHGHWDHIGGAFATKELAEADLLLHAADVRWLHDKRAHMEYLGVRFTYIDDPAGLSDTEAMLMENIAGELGADRELADGDRVDLGGDIVLDVVHTPGHSPGSASYVLRGQDWLFTGDAMQVGGSSGGRFPLYVDPAAYRASQHRMLEDVRPTRILAGHRFRNPDTERFYESVIEGDDVSVALRASLAMAERIAAAGRVVPAGARRAEAFAPAATALGLDPAAPATWPTAFLTTLSSYAR